MAIAAGQIIDVDDMQWRIATTIATSTTSTITTTETVTDTVTGDLVAGRTYKITLETGVSVSVQADQFLARIREDSLVGTQLQARRVGNHSTAQTYSLHVEVEYTAVSTGAKTFVATLVRSSGAGNITRSGSASTPEYFYIDYVRG